MFSNDVCQLWHFVNAYNCCVVLLFVFEFYLLWRCRRNASLILHNKNRGMLLTPIQWYGCWKINRWLLKSVSIFMFICADLNLNWKFVSSFYAPFNNAHKLL